jgi:hypothetical protein
MLPLIPKKLPGAAVEQVADQLRQLDAQDPAKAQLEMHKVATAAVQAHTQAGGFTSLDEAKMRAQALTGAAQILRGQEAPGAIVDVAELVARQAEQGAEIQERVAIKLGEYKKTDGVLPTGFEAASVFSLLRPLAPVLGLSWTHDPHFGQNVGKTAVGDGPEVRGQGRDAIHQRDTFLPVAEAVELAQIPGADGKPNDGKLLKIIAESGGGIDGTMQGLALYLNDLLPSKEKFSAQAAKELPDMLSIARPSAQAFDKVDSMLERTGYELARIREASDRDAGDGAAIRQAFAQNELGRGALEAAQTMWVRYDQNKEKPRFANPKHFDELTPSTAVGNLPAVLGAIEGTRAAMNTLRGLADRGLEFIAGKPSNELFMLQHALEASGHWALGLKDNKQKNEVHSRVVALSSAAQTLALIGKRNDDFFARLPNVMEAFNPMLFAAGEEFYKEGGKGAKVAAKIALEHSPNILASLGFVEPKQGWIPHIKDLVARASIEDVAKVTEMFQRAPIAKTGEELREEFAVRYKNDEWFIGHITGANGEEKLPTAKELAEAGKKPLSDDERRELSVIFFALNGTWIKGQPFRADGDRTRIMADKRDGVYDAYANLVGAKYDTSAAIYVVLKDLWEAVEKSRALA